MRNEITFGLLTAVTLLGACKSQEDRAVTSFKNFVATTLPGTAYKHAGSVHSCTVTQEDVRKSDSLGSPHVGVAKAALTDDNGIQIDRTDAELAFDEEDGEWVCDNAKSKLSKTVGVDPCEYGIMWCFGKMPANDDFKRLIKAGSLAANSGAEGTPSTPAPKKFDLSGVKRADSDAGTHETAASATPEQATPLETISVSRLCTAFSDNELAAKDRYEGKRVIVTGAVESVSESIGIRMVNFGKTLAAMSKTADMEKMKKLRSGTRVRLNCMCNGSATLSCVDLNDCDFAKDESPPPNGSGAQGTSKAPAWFVHMNCSGMEQGSAWESHAGSRDQALGRFCKQNCDTFGGAQFERCMNACHAGRTMWASDSCRLKVDHSQ